MPKHHSPLRSLSVCLSYRAGSHSKPLRCPMLCACVCAWLCGVLSHLNDICFCFSFRYENRTDAEFSLYIHQPSRMNRWVNRHTGLRWGHLPSLLRWRVHRGNFVRSTSPAMCWASSFSVMMFMQQCWPSLWRTKISSQTQTERRSDQIAAVH